jgi:hypothetical protein
MTTEELATIIATGDVPLSMRMSQDIDESSDARKALDVAESLRRSGDYDGMSYEQVLAQLKQNRAEAEAEEE